MNKTRYLVALLPGVIFLSGCAIAWLGAGAGLGVGAYRYVEGTLEADYSLTYDEAWEATNTALANLYISVTNSVNEGDKGKIEAIRKNGKHVIVNLQYKSPDITSINIRVGFFGSREDSERIHEEIRTVSGLIEQ
jgi:hypothetical protein